MRLEIRSISVQSGLNDALRRVSMELRAGQKRAILGGFGSGKSALAAVLGGMLRPNAGEILLDGHRYAPRHLRDARAAGIAVLPQLSEATQIPLALTVEEALLLGFESGQLKMTHRRIRREAAFRALLSLRSDDIPLALPLYQLPENQRRRVALARALMGQPRLVVLDEPPPLPEYDRGSLLNRLSELAAAGSAILLLTRSPDLARALGGSVSLLRDGLLDPPIASLPPGFRIDQEAGELPGRRLRPVLGPVVLAVHHAMNADLHAPVNLTIREGEIMGLAGVPGSGRRALLRMLAGLEPMITGALHLDGRQITRSSPGQRQKSGLSFLSAEEEDAALLPDRPTAENLLLPRLGGSSTGRPAGRSLTHWGIVDPDAVNMTALDWMEKLRIRPGSPCEPVGQLSRANRHRLLLGRLLQARGRALLLFDPTRHLSADLRIFLYGWLSEMAAEGRSVLLAGPSPRELLSFCDTIAALRPGRLVACHPVAEWSEAKLEEAITPTGTSAPRSSG